MREKIVIVLKKNGIHLCEVLFVIFFEKHLQFGAVFPAFCKNQTNVAFVAKKKLFAIYR